MVAECDRVDPSRAAVGEARRDPDSVRCVLAVHDADVDLALGAEGRKARFEGTAAGSANDVGDEEDAQGAGEVYGTPREAEG